MRKEPSVDEFKDYQVIEKVRTEEKMHINVNTDLAVSHQCLAEIVSIENEKDSTEEEFGSI